MGFVFCLIATFFTVRGLAYEVGEVDPITVKIEPEEGKFVAAVYEAAPANPIQKCIDTVCTRADAKVNMKENLDTFSKQAAAAKSKNADIIVFPEWAIQGYVLDRKKQVPFAEFVPDPETLRREGLSWVPCFQPEPLHKGDAYVQKMLSCIAATYKIYVVANMVDLQECSECGEDICIYNTNVAYDKNGKFVGRYHKSNLFNTDFYILNVEKKPQNITIDTEFGRLGLIACADLMWKSPTVDLVDFFDIDTLIVPAYWPDIWPYILPIAQGASKARSLQVNLLMPNYHHPWYSSGSGIYTTEGPLAYYSDLTPDSAPRLLIAQLPIHPTKLPYAIKWGEYAKAHQSEYPEGQVTFSANMFGIVVQMAQMDPNRNKVKVCSSGNGQLCCLADYNYSSDGDDDIYSIGVFHGIHYNEGITGVCGVSLCTVLKCSSKHPAACQAQPKNFAGATSKALFSKLELSGTFAKTTRVFPQMVFKDKRLISNLEDETQDGRIRLDLSGGKKNYPLVSMTLFGRNFEDDGPVPLCPLKSK